MQGLSDITKEYFQARTDYFWKWSNDGEFLEWADGGSICHRKDLMEILTALSPHGLPPLGAVLLLLSACRQPEKWEKEGTQILLGIPPMLKRHLAALDTYSYSNKGLQGMLLVGKLPDELRKGKHRKHLAFELFKEMQGKIAESISKDLIDEFESGRHDDEIMYRFGEKMTHSDFKKDLEAFKDLSEVVKNADELENILRTGHYDLPEAPEIEIPETEDTLLQALAADPKTEGLARLTERLIAGMNIPMKTRGTSDMAMGGISDITNKGDFDKLLLSELAYDDAMLSARLVNNEALFLRHEEPPANPVKERIILIDTTFRTWGEPKMFAMAAALACSEQKKEEMGIRVFTLGMEAEAASLDSPAGVKDAISKASIELDCGTALEDFFKENRPTNDQEFIFITDESVLNNEVFKKKYIGLRENVDVQISLNREGDLFLTKINKGFPKFIGKTRYDLDELLFKTRRNKDRRKPVKGEILFLQEKYSPLYYPTIGMRPRGSHFYSLNSGGYVGINENGRLLYWFLATKGAIEIMPRIEGERFFFGEQFGKLHVLVENVAGLFSDLYSLDLERKKIQHFSLDGLKGDRNNLRYYEGCFYTASLGSAYKIEGATGVVHTQDFWETNEFVKKSLYRNNANHFTNAKQYINPGYNAMRKTKNLRISKEGEIWLNGRRLSADTVNWASKSGELFFVQGSMPEGISPEHGKTSALITENKSVDFKRMDFKDGTRIYADSRGLVHIVPANNVLPQVTIINVTGQSTAAWASDGATTGNKYFIRKTFTNHLDSGTFHEKYIKPIVKNILK